MKKLEKIEPKLIERNVIEMIGDEWMLVTAGDRCAFNSMTASWGGMGVMWNKPATFVFIRPQRFTFEFMERGDYFTLSFFDEKYRDALVKCGNLSGRDTDKVEATGLTPLVLELGSVAYEQANLILECRKMYADFIENLQFVDRSIVDEHYPARDFHKMYISEIVGAYKL
jgi:flavin reductase (DIM6/NTAB) family NADH-FMN oxidoreductase RutF